MAIQQLLQSKQGGIPPEMAALIQLREAAKVLKQSASAVTPSGQPTVASQDTQQALAMLLPEPPQQPGMQDLMPGVQQRAGEMAQAQQPVTQAQLQQAMAQRAPGIAGLPADVQMAEGGIVGYSGTTGSEVKSQAEEDREKIAALLKTVKEKGLLPAIAAATDVATAIPRGLTGAYNSTIIRAMRAAGLPAAYLPDIAGGDFSNATPFYDRTVRGQSSTDTGDEAARLAARFAKPEALTPQQMEAQVKEAAGRSYQPDASLFRSSGPRPPAAPAAASAAPASGVASLMGPPEPAGSERQFGEAIAAAGRIAEPETITPEQLQAQREAVYRARGIDPDFAKRRLEGIERLKAMDDAAKAEYAQSKKDIAWENVATRLAARGGARSWGEGARNAQLLMAQRYGEQRKADQQFNQLMRVNEEARIKELNAIDDMNRALADGDIGRAEKRKQEILEARNVKNATEAKMRAQYAPQLLQAETAALDRASRERDIEARAKESALTRAAQEKIAGMQSVPAEIKLLEWMRDPRNKKLYEEAQSLKREDDRMAKLYEVYTKNKMQLGDMSFEEFVAGFKVGAGATGAMTAPPAGAVREKSKG